ncbi:MAG: signal peptidase II [bacterium]
MRKIHRLYITALVVTCCVGCDQFTKEIAETNLKMTPPQSYLGNVFRLQYAENTGAFLSLGAQLPEIARTWLFTILSGALLALLLLYMIFNRDISRKHVLALSLILGGGLSNLIDRIVNDGRVIDFMNMGVGKLRTGVFNFADVVIMLGMGLILFLSFSVRSQSKPEEHADPDLL